MSDFTTYRLYNIPVFLYGMIGLTLGIITFSTLKDDTGPSVATSISQGISSIATTSPTPISNTSNSISGGKRKTPKHQHRNDGKNKTQKSK